MGKDKAMQPREDGEAEGLNDEYLESSTAWKTYGPHERNACFCTKI